FSAVFLQKVPSAAARVAKLPVVSSVCSKLLVLYTDTKRSHPNLKSVCEVLENSVTGLGSAACDRVSPVIVKLEPQISIANDVACKSLDWLETTFPVIHAPTEEVSFPFSLLNELQIPYLMYFLKKNKKRKARNMFLFFCLSPRLLPVPRARSMRSRML
uniref:Uncharacterized protein n=1 Tax=Mastacembelus armatus TaxID=205130 RepID=A0A3Q3N4E8_9TELE